MARTLPCLVWSRAQDFLDVARALCIGVVEPDHVRTRGARGKDWANVVPLCHGHHSERHTIGIRTFERCYDLDLDLEAQRVALAVDPSRCACARPEPCDVKCGRHHACGRMVR